MTKAESGAYRINAANSITLLRILLAIAMLWVPPFTRAFWACYLGAIVSDVLDGVVARLLKQQSDFGAKLDSAADFIFACAIAAIALIHMDIPAWLWIFAAVIALCRFVGYGIGYRRYRTFSALHTCANKAAGGMICGFPALYALLGINVSGVLLCAVALYAAVEEVLITVSSKELDRNRRSIFSNRQKNTGK